MAAEGLGGEVKVSKIDTTFLDKLTASPPSLFMVIGVPLSLTGLRKAVSYTQG